MSHKNRTIKLSLAYGHDRINCIRLVRMMTTLHLWSSKKVVDKLEEGEIVELVVSRIHLSRAINEGMLKHGLLWKGVDK